MDLGQLEHFRRREDLGCAEGHTEEHSDYKTESQSFFHFDFLLFQCLKHVSNTAFPDGIPSISHYFMIQFGSNMAISGKNVMMKRMTTIGI